MTGHENTLDHARWPVFNKEVAKEDELTIVVQVNGKVRAKLQVPADISDQDLEEQALSNERVCSFLGDRVPKKVIVVKKKLVNIVG